MLFWVGIYHVSERYYPSCVKFCTEEPTTCSLARTDACPFEFEVQNWFRGITSARDYWFSSKGYSIKHCKLSILFLGRSGLLVSRSLKWPTFPAGNFLGSSYWFPMNENFLVLIIGAIEFMTACLFSSCHKYNGITSWRFKTWEIV